MNVILTTTCNKNCSFCFATNKADNNQFDIEKLKRMTLENPTEMVKLIGGEPTLYKDFVELMSFLETVPNEVVLISNFLIHKPEVRKAIIDFQKKKTLTFLLNSSETTEKQYDIMIKNMKELIAKRAVSLGFTFSEDRTFEDYKSWLDRFIADVGDKILNLRTSVTFPANGNKDNFYLYKNTKLANLFHDFIEYSFNHKLGVSIDCGLFPCMFENRRQFENILFWVSETKIGCSGGAFDIFPNGDATLCYPRKDININIDNYSGNLKQAFKHILNKKTHIIAKETMLPKECLSCEYLHKECAGPCLGFCQEG